MDRYYSEWTENVITQLWLTEAVCPPDCNEAKTFIATFSNGEFSVYYLPKDAVGVYLEFYIGLVLEQCNFPYIPHPNGTQAFPDYTVGDDWIEVKAFDTNNAPAFDIITYHRLLRALSEGDYGVLYSDFIVLGYQYHDDNSMHIESAGMYKIWELVNCYIEDGAKYVSVNSNGIIRPRGNLLLNDKSTPPAFEDEYEFVTALYNSICRDDGEYEAERWLAQVQENTLLC